MTSNKINPNKSNHIP